MQREKLQKTYGMVWGVNAIFGWQDKTKPTLTDFEKFDDSVFEIKYSGNSVEVSRTGVSEDSDSRLEIYFESIDPFVYVLFRSLQLLWELSSIKVQRCKGIKAERHKGRKAQRQKGTKAEFTNLLCRLSRFRLFVMVLKTRDLAENCGCGNKGMAKK